MSIKFMIKWISIAASVGALLRSVAYADHGVGVSASCMMAYQQGGIPAVLTSPFCPWLFSSVESSNYSSKNCQLATLQGRREYQEDRLVCNLHLKLPFSDGFGFFYAGQGEPVDTTIGIAAIFDGHGGDEASEMASAMLSSYFLMNTVFAAYNRVIPSNEEYNTTYCSPRMTPAAIDRHSLHSILEEALLRTIQDIDSEFSKVALDKRYISGSTGTIVLLFEGQLLVANVGDSKALLCSKKVISHHETEGDLSKGVYVEELTRDHHPDREDEKARIKAAGGFITQRGVPRVNGILALSRAIGDIYLKRYGVTAEAEITGWRAFTPENSYLIVASDGVFETLTPDDVCKLVHAKASKFIYGQVPASSLPEWIIRRAFETGSTDNLSAIVVSDLVSCIKDRCDRERTDLQAS